MKILAIETSCDETAVAVVEATGDDSSATFEVLGNVLLSQIELHREYGGVYPTLAKREHAKNLIPVTRAALTEASMITSNKINLDANVQEKIKELLHREPDMSDAFIEFIQGIEIPDIDVIAVTHGPGLAPALWVGVNFAQALALAWNKPLVPINHMEGHIVSSLLQDGVIEKVELPLLALLISGGHTELVLMKEWLSYELIGQTRDDAVGEAFDKVARMIDLPYPGGPEISKLAELVRKEGGKEVFSFPRPMLHSKDCDFSFAGLKTSVLYTLKDIENVTEEDKKNIAHSFENAVTEVLVKKTLQAIEDHGVQTLVLGGGVSANHHIRRVFEETITNKHSGVSLFLPEPKLTTDNAIMIGIAGFYRALRKEFADEISADSNLSVH
ncbi:tRNA (adenosine(37)-N6)-threonylcarbamoyltransferase complex transferase subunit TsaD [Candidatus Wolfebacteria bacterium]|nr:tRNA (adenosine(37)-N6)-threonylcarbamoyltransferase complex transferase subunit TsaD [Candidatus Wolfebacteria bacterium]